jgi:hypothetical protein
LKSKIRAAISWAWTKEVANDFVRRWGALSQQRRADLIDILISDPNPEVRHKAVAALARFIRRDGRAAEAIARTASDDPDAAIRLVARTVADGGQPHVRGRKAALRDARRQRRSSR